MKVGDKVTYHCPHGEVANGIVKSFSDEKHVFVVYHCNDDWKNYQDYTGQRTPIENMTEGWTGSVQELEIANDLRS